MVKVTPKTSPSERQIMRAFFEWVKAMRALDPSFNLINHYPAQCPDPKWASIMAADGADKGWPDIQILVPRNKWHGAFVEVKVPGKFARNEQVITLDRLHAMGYLTTQLHSVDSLIDFTRSYLKGVL